MNEREIGEDWRYVDEEWDIRHGKTESGAGEGKYSHMSCTEEVEIPDAREIKAATLAATKEKLRGGSMRLVAYETN